MKEKGHYRKYNDRGNNSSTYHKKDGTPVRAILKEESRKEIDDELRIAEQTLTAKITE